MNSYSTFFQHYVDTFNRSMGEAVDVDAIRGVYAEYFVSASNGAVQGGANDDDYASTLRKGAAFYKSIGLTRMNFLRAEPTAIDDGHDMVKAFFRSDYRRKDGSDVSIPFDVTYMLQRRPDGPRIFGFVSGDEMALYREFGLVDEDGKPI